MINKIKNSFLEVRILIKTNLLFYIFSLFVLTSLLVIIGVLSSLHLSSYSKGEEISTIYNGKDFYAMIDSFYNPDEFFEYRQNKENINKIGKFYNSINSSSQFDYLSMFNQPINVMSFPAGENFLYNSQEFIEEHTESVSNIKSLQINQNAFEFYNLEINTGSSFDWESIDYRTREIPILLGSEYKEFYEIGSLIDGEFYFEDIVFTVAGFLDPNSFIYYKGDPEFYLDQYMIIPYPNECHEIKSSNFEFEGILYFAMINGDLASNASKEDLTSEMRGISEETGFHNFSIVGLPEVALKYDEIISVINENINLLYISIMLIFILVIIIQHGFSRIILTRRQSVYKTYKLIGNYNDRKIFMLDIGIVYPLAFVLSNIILMIGFQNISIYNLLITLLISILIFTISYLTCKKIYNNKIEKIM